MPRSVGFAARRRDRYGNVDRRHRVSRRPGRAGDNASFSRPVIVAGCRASRLGSEGDAEILCFGDSLIKLGILPEVLEGQIGSSAYNLAVLGGRAPASFFLLRRVLASGVRPTAIIVDFSALMLTASPRFDAGCWAELAGRRDWLDLAWRTRDPTLAVSIAVHWLLPSWGNRDCLRSAVCDRLAPDRELENGDDPPVSSATGGKTAAPNSPRANSSLSNGPALNLPAETAGGGNRTRPMFCTSTRS